MAQVTAPPPDGEAAPSPTPNLAGRYLVGLRQVSSRAKGCRGLGPDDERLLRELLGRSRSEGEDCRGAVFGVVAATGTLPGLLAPALTGHFIDASDTPAAGYTTSFLVAAAVMLLAGAFAIVAIRPERDARRGKEVRWAS